VEKDRRKERRKIIVIGSFHAPKSVKVWRLTPTSSRTLRCCWMAVRFWIEKSRESATQDDETRMIIKIEIRVRPIYVG
jgi:hypothetical protein